MEKARKLYSNADKAYFNSSLPLSDNTINKYEQAKSLCIKHNLDNSLLVQIYLKLGMCYQEKDKRREALSNYKNALAIKEGISSGLDHDYFEIYTYTGDVYNQLDEFDSAYFFYTKVDQQLSHYTGITGDMLLSLYNSLGTLYYSAGNYKQSINYFEKALENGEKLFGKDAIELIFVKNNIAASLLKSGKYKESLIKYQELLKNNNGAASFIYHNMGKAYLASNHYDSALYCFKKVNPDDFEAIHKINLYNNIGVTYRRLNEPAKSLEYHNLAIETNNVNSKGRNVALAQCYIDRAKVFESLQNLKMALDDYQQAIITLNYSFKSLDIYKNPEDPGNTISSTHQFQALENKARALKLLYNKTNDLGDLKAALQTFELAAGLAARIRKSYDSDEAKLFYSNIVYPIYEDAVETAYLLYTRTKDSRYKDLTFAFNEQSKLAVLNDILNDLEIKHLPEIPSDLILREKEIKRNIGRLTIKAKDARDSLTFISIKNQLREYEISLDKVLKQYEQNKDYFRLKYSTNSQTPANIQKYLSGNNEAYLEYFLGKNDLYFFLITKDRYIIKRIPVNTSFLNSLTQLTQALYNTKTGIKYKGDKQAFELYKYLILPVREELSSIQRLIIVPHNELSYIPFEALITDLPSKRYLINDYTIDYLYSGSVLNYNKKQQSDQENINSILALAPFATYGSAAPKLRRGLFALPASKNEVQNIGGLSYLNSQATKSLFLKTLNHYDIIHLATHAQANSDDPLSSFIAFYPSVPDSAASYKLYMPELYNLRMDSVKLVVLGACETGTGKFLKGEGIISLARGFAYAGCTNIVMSLWSAEDMATSQILTGFHKYLKKGYDKDEALRSAKLDYLNSDIDSKYKTPVYWANIIFTGDSDAIYTKSNSLMIWGGIALLITLISLSLFIFLIKRSNIRIGGN